MDASSFWEVNKIIISTKDNPAHEAQMKSTGDVDISLEEAKLLRSSLDKAIEHYETMEKDVQNDIG